MNKGLKALKKASPKACAKIMGAMAIDGMKNPYGDKGLLLGNRAKARDQGVTIAAKDRKKRRVRKIS